MGRREDMIMWCRTVGLMLTLALSLLVAPLAIEAQPPTKVSRIGVLIPGASLPSLRWETCQQSLRDLGYVEGQNLVIEYRYAEHNLERLPDLAAELVRLPVDLIVASETTATRAAQHATSTIPIIMAGVG